MLLGFWVPCLPCVAISAVFAPDDGQTYRQPGREKDTERDRQAATEYLTIFPFDILINLCGGIRLDRGISSPFFPAIPDSLPSFTASSLPRSRLDSIASITLLLVLAFAKSYPIEHNHISFPELLRDPNTRDCRR